MTQLLHGVQADASTSLAGAVHAGLQGVSGSSHFLKLWSVGSEPITSPTLWDGIAGCQGGGDHIVVAVSRCQPGLRRGNKEAAVTVS